MIALPKLLAPWAQELAIFPHDVALVVGELASRLTALLGSGEETEAPHGIPDGFDGIDVRGTYDRLVTSEWLLLDELPDEFMRRVVSKEHAFLKRAHRTDGAKKRVVALFDASAEQLGAPRVVQIALLVVLAQRATRRGAALFWGTLQDQTFALHGARTQESIGALLRTRGRPPATAANIAQWRVALAAVPTSETWFVGAAAVAEGALATGASAISLRELIAPQTTPDAVRVAVEARPHEAARPRALMLHVPTRRAAVQLLRDPFSSIAPSRNTHATALASDTTLEFEIRGRRLFARTQTGGLLVINVPNSPNATVAPPWVFQPPAGEILRAAGRSHGQKGRVVVVTEKPDGFTVHRLSKRGGTSGSAQHFAMAAIDASDHHARRTLGPLACLDGDRYMLVDGASRLIFLEADAASAWDAPLSSVVPTYTGLRYATMYDDGIPRVKLAHVASRSVAPVLQQLPGDFQDATTPITYFNVGFARVLHVNDGTPEGMWRIFDDSAPDMPPIGLKLPGHRVIGVDVANGPWALLAIAPSGTCVRRMSQTASEPLIDLDARIVTATWLDWGLIALLTDRGEVLIYSTSGRLQTRIQTGAS